MAEDLMLHICAKRHKSSNFIFKSYKLSAMNSKILLAALVIAGFTSCSTVYKSGQTPDDVYYSPVRTIEQKQETQREEQQTNDETAQDREIRMRIRDRRWRYNDYDYSYNNTYNHNCNCYCNQYGYGYYNHPYYRPIPYYTPKSVVINSTPRMVNLGGYGNNSGTTVTNPKTGVKTTTGRVYNNTNNSNNGTGLGNTIRQIFKPAPRDNNNSNTNTNTNSNNNTRTYQPSSTPSSTPSSGGSSGGSVSRPGRGGK